MKDGFIHKTVVLTQRSRVDRRYLFDQHAEEHGLDYRYFFAIEDTDPKKSFNLSHKAILTQFVKSNLNTMLVLEDDADIRNLEAWDDLAAQLPMDWEMIYLGANVKPTPDFTPPRRVDKNLFRIYNAWTTHAIIYHRRMAEWIVKNYDAGMMFDAWLDQNIAQRKAYICCPFLSWQRPSRSDLWDRVVDYTDTFQASENYLNSLP